MLRQVTSALAVLAAVAVLPHPRVLAQVEPPLLSPVLPRAATYVERFADRVSGFVTAESYQQDVFLPMNRFGTRPGGQRPYSGPIHRKLKADLLLVRPVGSDGWVQFRDVTEVDGEKLKDRNDRLARLFLGPSTSTASTASQSRKIMTESARYNIGDIERNINLPVPIEMFERYEHKLNGTRVERSATCSNFREFKVAVDEDIAPVDDKGKQVR